MPLHKKICFSKIRRIQKYEYAFQKYGEYKNTNTLFQNTTGKKANTFIFDKNLLYFEFVGDK